MAALDKPHDPDNPRARDRALDASAFVSGARRRPEEQALEVCAACGSTLVQPVDWRLVRRDLWSVIRRCPECGWEGGGTYGQEAVDRYDEALDRGTEAILDDLSELARARMEESVERFAAALHAGWILPEDFGREPSQE